MLRVFFFFLIEGWLLYSIVLVSSKHQHEFAIGTHISPLIESPFHLPSHPTLQVMTEPQVGSPESYSKCPLPIGFIYGNVCFHVFSEYIPLVPSSPLPSVHKSVRSLSLHCCPVNRVIGAIFLDTIYMCVSIRYLFFSFWLTSLYIIGSRFIISLDLTQMCSFLWLSNIPLYICTTASLSIHLLMGI